MRAKTRVPHAPSGRGPECTPEQPILGDCNAGSQRDSCITERPGIIHVFSLNDVIFFDMKTSVPLRRTCQIVACSVVLFVLISCSGSMVMKSELEKTTRAYADALRWRKAEGLSAYAVGPLREEFESRLRAFGEVIVTDYRIVSVDFDERHALAVVEADVTYYRVTSNRVKSIRDRQVWSYAGADGQKRWQLTTLLPVFP